MTKRLDTAAILTCYRRGLFPMAESQDDPNLFLVDPDMRGVLPLDDFHVPRRLRKTVRGAPYEIRSNTAFEAVLEGCAAPAPGRENTWINPLIGKLYTQLHRAGHAHCVEAWRQDELVGGLYGVAIGGAFFGESMFSRARDASKIALVHLAGLLIRNGFILLDAQFHNPHLEQFGLIEVTRTQFRSELAKAIHAPASFTSDPTPPSGEESLDLIASVRRAG
jgi:leucyl/phenylalanyl-tRNA---protein transferase